MPFPTNTMHICLAIGSKSRNRLQLGPLTSLRVWQKEYGELYQDTLESDSFPQTLPPPHNTVTEAEAETVRIN